MAFWTLVYWQLGASASLFCQFPVLWLYIFLMWTNLKTALLDFNIFYHSLVMSKHSGWCLVQNLQLVNSNDSML